MTITISGHANNAKAVVTVTGADGETTVSEHNGVSFSVSIAEGTISIEHQAMDAEDAAAPTPEPDTMRTERDGHQE